MQHRQTARIHTVSNSHLPFRDHPETSDIPSLSDAIAKYHSAMFCADDCLTRCREALHFEDVSHCNFEYGDRQLMLASQYIEKARIAIELAKRVIVAAQAVEPKAAAEIKLFTDEQAGPYRGDRL